jgi:hypothetical protein
MSLKAKIKAAVKKAFAAAGDLVVSGTLSTKTVSDYNFATGSATSVTRKTTVKVIFLTKNRSGDSAFKQEAIIESGVDITLYDTLTLGSGSSATVYNIESFADDGFAITMQLVREK